MPEPSGAVCAACHGSGTVLVLDGEHGTAAALGRYPMPYGPDRLVIACPVCRSGRAAEATNYLARLHRYDHQSRAVQAAEALAMAEHPAGWLSLTGGYGAGKTTLARATIRTLQSRGIGVRAFTAPELKDGMFAGFRSGTYSGWLASLKGTRALCIDELDSVAWGTEQIEEFFSELINARYQQAGASITILAAAKLHRIPERITSRMHHYGIQDLGETDLRHR